ncbi:WD40-repeat-containing domain protein [Boletus reticuloceps]|uniref:WD40-repeat-containing domain protein n=1 Tax=Boletus reticuloceps TaxID=495285 RepID=A0A8I2YYL6_9AGAM|nr:WD40-repeat-containing domain protein [Boletus reticuloceps]
MVCACNSGKTIQIWNIREDHGEGEPPMNLDVPLNVIASSKDGKTIVTGDKAGKVMIWDTSFKKPCETAERHGRLITALDVSSGHIASGSEDGTVVVWKMGKPGLPPEWCRSMRHGLVAVSSVKFSPAGNRIASACADWGSDVRTWHTRTGDQIRSIHVGGSPIYSLTWSSDGRQLFIGRSHGSISRFDLVTQESSKVVEHRPGDDSITSLHISNSGRFLVSFSSPGQTVDIWDIRDTPACEPLHSYSQCVAASVSPDDIYLASGGDDARISILSLPKLLEPSFFFLRLAPLLRHSEPFTYISPAAYRACKLGEPEQAEHILSREIEDKRYPDFDCYSHANRALVRIRRGDLNGALDDAAKIVTNGSEIPLIVHVAQAMALIGQGKRKEARDSLGSVDQGDAKHFVDCVESIFLFEAELRDKLYCGTEPAGPSPLEDANSYTQATPSSRTMYAEKGIQ